MRYQCLRYREPTAMDILGSIDMEDSWQTMRQTFEIQSNLSLGVTQGKHKHWLLKTGDPLIQVHLHYILISLAEVGQDHFIVVQEWRPSHVVAKSS